MTTIVVAYNSKRVIGKSGGIPWVLKEDMEHFYNTTCGGNVIMGYNTWRSIGEFPMRNRNNFIVTRKVDFMNLGCYGEQFHPSVESAIDVTEDIACETFIVGGAEIYEYCLENHIGNKIIATEVDTDEDGDKVFPELSDDWVETSRVKMSEKAHVVTYKRK